MSNAVTNFGTYYPTPPYITVGEALHQQQQHKELYKFSIEKVENGFLLHYKSKTRIYVSMEDLSKDLIAVIASDKLGE